jgi:hypothetical protein
MILWLGTDMPDKPAEVLGEARGTGCEIRILQVNPSQTDVVFVPEFASRYPKTLEPIQEFVVTH